MASPLSRKYSWIGILGIMLVLLMLNNCDESIMGQGEIEAPPLHLELKLENKRVDTFQDLKADFTVTNISNQAVIYEFPSGCQFGFMIKKDENLLLDSRNHYGCIAILTQLKLEPGESKTYPISLDSMDEGVTETLEPGQYQMQAFLLEGHSPEVEASFILF